MRVLDTNKLERREGKDESYWPVGVVGDNLMCLILKGRQEHPGFPRPLIQELPIRLPFKRTDPKEAPLEEQFARESMQLEIIRDGLGEELTTDTLAARELVLDKALIQLIQHACKTDRLARALDLTRMLHHTPSFDAAIKIANFYHLIGLKEKMEALKEEREDSDRLEGLRDRRRQIDSDFAPVPAMRLPTAGGHGQNYMKPKPFQDFGPPPPMHRPGLERATPAPDVRNNGISSSQMTEDSTVFGTSYADSTQDNDASHASPEGKRKRLADDEPMPDIRSPGVDSGAKRRAFGGDSASAARMPPPVAVPSGWCSSVTSGSRTDSYSGSNPFARKPAADNNNNRNPFSRTADANKSLHKSESFFAKVDAAEAEKGKRLSHRVFFLASTDALLLTGPTQKSKGKEKKDGGKQTTLFGFQPTEKDKKVPAAAARKKKSSPAEESQDSTTADTQIETQQTDVVMVDSQPDDLAGEDTQTDSQLDGGDTQVDTQIEETQLDDEVVSPISLVRELSLTH